MSVRFAAIVLILSLILPLAGLGQEYAIYSYQSNEFPDLGLVTTIFQDSRGIMWFGGDKGAAYYDGREFHRFSSKNGLPDNYTYTIKESPEGEIWICTWHGISIYDPWQDELRGWGGNLGLPIRDVEFIDEGMILGASWSPVYVQGIGMYDMLQFKHSVENYTVTPVYDVYFDQRTNKLWTATEQVGVMAVDLQPYSVLWEMKDKDFQAEFEISRRDEILGKYPEKDIHNAWLSNMYLDISVFVIDDTTERKRIIDENTQIYDFSEAESHLPVKSIQQDHSGDFYAYAGGKVYKLGDGKFEVVDMFNRLGGELDWFDINSHGEFIFAGDKGLFVIGNEDTLHFNVETGLTSNEVSACFRDKQTIIWLTTSDGRLHKVVDSSIRIYDSETFPVLKETESVIRLKDGSVLIGGRQGLAQVDEGRIESFFFQPPVNEQFLGFCYDRNEDLVMVTNNSIFLHRSNSVRCLAENLDIVYNNVEFLLDKKGILWIIMGMEVFIWDGKALTTPNILKDYLYFSIYSYVAPDSSMFFGTWRELYHVKSDTLWKIRNTSSSFLDLAQPETGFEYSRIYDEQVSADHVMTCGARGPDSVYWFGTFGGGGGETAGGFFN